MQCSAVSNVGDQSMKNDNTNDSSLQMQIYQTKARPEVGCTYRGTFLQDLYSGQGVLEHTDGETFVGTFQTGQRLHGVCRKKDGSVFEGDFSGDKRDGHGVFAYPSGARYEGGWKGV